MAEMSPPSPRVRDPGASGRLDVGSHRTGQGQADQVARHRERVPWRQELFDLPGVTTADDPPPGGVDVLESYPALGRRRLIVVGRSTPGLGDLSGLAQG